MKEFLKQCLDDLESLTGIRQLFFLENDPDGKRKIEVLINGMLLKCKEFSFIPESDQKNIIRSMMVKDQQYDALNSRTLDKWLNGHSAAYTVEKPVEVKRIELTPEENERVDKLIESWKMQVFDFKPKYTGLENEIEKIKTEDDKRLKGRKSEMVKQSIEALEISNRKMKAAKDRGLDKLNFCGCRHPEDCNKGLHHIEVEGKVIVARNRSEAQDIYMEVFL